MQIYSYIISKYLVRIVFKINVPFGDIFFWENLLKKKVCFFVDNENICATNRITRIKEFETKENICPIQNIWQTC